jgi:hypothetical protein
MLDIRAITFDCADSHLMASFWSRAAGWTEDPTNPNLPGDVECMLVAGAVEVTFIPVPEAKDRKNRLHLDLVPDGPREAEVERLLSIGATLVADHREPNGYGWVVLADPEGNEFCVERSEAERACK